MKMCDVLTYAGSALYSCGLGQVLAVPGSAIAGTVQGIYQARANYFEKKADKTAEGKERETFTTKAEFNQSRAKSFEKIAKFSILGSIPLVGGPIAVWYLRKTKVSVIGQQPLNETTFRKPKPPVTKPSIDTLEIPETAV